MSGFGYLYLTQSTDLQTGQQLVAVVSTAPPEQIKHKLSPAGLLRAGTTIRAVHSSDDFHCLWFDAVGSRLLFTAVDRRSTLCTADVVEGGGVSAPRVFSLCYGGVDSLLGTSDGQTLFVGATLRGEFANLCSINLKTRELKEVATRGIGVAGMSCLRFDRSDRYPFESVLYFLSHGGALCSFQLHTSMFRVFSPFSPRCHFYRYVCLPFADVFACISCYECVQSMDSMRNGNFLFARSGCGCSIRSINASAVRSNSQPNTSPL